eukprot:Hpha_TRINITY_DN14109_c0_g1::TRINITY_DN14109_c0_g1_i1::g.10889::m.10889
MFCVCVIVWLLFSPLSSSMVKPTLPLHQRRYPGRLLVHVIVQGGKCTESLADILDVVPELRHILPVVLIKVEVLLLVCPPDLRRIFRPAKLLAKDVLLKVEDVLHRPVDHLSLHLHLDLPHALLVVLGVAIPFVDDVLPVLLQHLLPNLHKLRHGHELQEVAELDGDFTRLFRAQTVALMRVVRTKVLENGESGGPLCEFHQVTAALPPRFEEARAAAADEDFDAFVHVAHPLRTVVLRSVPLDLGEVGPNDTDDKVHDDEVRQHCVSEEVYPREYLVLVPQLEVVEVTHKHPHARGDTLLDVLETSHSVAEEGVPADSERDEDEEEYHQDGHDVLVCGAQGPCQDVETLVQPEVLENLEPRNDTVGRVEVHVELVQVRNCVQLVRITICIPGQLEVEGQTLHNPEDTEPEHSQEGTHVDQLQSVPHSVRRSCLIRVTSFTEERAASTVLFTMRAPVRQKLPTVVQHETVEEELEQQVCVLVEHVEAPVLVLGQPRTSLGYFPEVLVRGKTVEQNVVAEHLKCNETHIRGIDKTSPPEIVRPFDRRREIPGEWYLHDVPPARVHLVLCGDAVDKVAAAVLAVGVQLPVVSVRLLVNVARRERIPGVVAEARHRGDVGRVEVRVNITAIRPDPQVPHP